MLSQFSSDAGKTSLSDIISLPKDVYPVGRLDYDSEGLLLLTNDVKINNKLLTPKYKHEREYWVQVEGLITTTAINELQQGPEISIDGKKHKCMPCTVTVFATPPLVADRNPPIRYRKEIPTCWIKIILHEGKNRQVRRMTAKVGFPTLRLIRTRIGQVSIENWQPGQLEEKSRQYVYHALFNE